MVSPRFSVISPSNTLTCRLQQIHAARRSAAAHEDDLWWLPFSKKSINSVRLASLVGGESEILAGFQSDLAQRPSNGVKGATINACATLTRE
jgi:hypothetical protein